MSTGTQKAVADSDEFTLKILYVGIAVTALIILRELFSWMVKTTPILWKISNMEVQLDQMHGMLSRVLG